MVGQRRRLLDYLKATKIDRYRTIVKELGLRKQADRADQFRPGSSGAPVIRDRAVIRVSPAGPSRADRWTTRPIPGSFFNCSSVSAH